MGKNFFCLLLFSISLQAADQLHPAVAFDGENFLVVWQEMKSDSQSEIHGMRFDLSGNKMDQTPIQISPLEDNACEPDIVFSSEYFISWIEKNTHFLHCARVSSSGTVIDNSIEIRGITLYNTSKPSISFDGTNYLHAHVNYYPVYCTRISLSGEKIDSLKIGSLDCSSDAKVTFGIENYLVVWKNFG